MAIVRRNWINCYKPTLGHCFWSPTTCIGFKHIRLFGWTTNCSLFSSYVESIRPHGLWDHSLPSPWPILQSVRWKRASRLTAGSPFF